MLLDLRNLFGRKKASKVAAKSRLHFVLVQDRTGLTNQELANFKQEMVGVIEKYFVVDKNKFDIDYKRDTDLTTLVINSPIVVRRQEGLKHQVGSKHKKAATENDIAEIQEAAQS